MLLKVGSKGQEVIELQQALDIEADGIFGEETRKAVEDFQIENGLMVDGLAGSQTLSLLQEINATTDHFEKVYSPSSSLIINKYYLPKDEYIQGPTKKEYLFLHHTAGWHNPYKTVDDWARDNRGRIATEFVMGGRSVRGDDDQYDGEVVQCIPRGGYGWHLGKNGSQYMHTHSVAIEVCNFSYAKDGLTYVNTPIQPEQLIELPAPFRGHKFWHAYSDRQIEMLKLFILWIAERDTIDVQDGIIAEIKQKGMEAFEFNEDAYTGKIKGMWSHTNIRKDKYDMFPQENLIDMLISL